MRKSAAIIGILLSFTLFSRETSAQSRKGNWEIDGFFGPTFYGSELKLGNENQIGIRASYNFSEWLGVQMSYDTVSTQVEDIDSTLIIGSLPPGEVFDMDVDTVKLDLLITGATAARRWRGYGVVGLGKIFFNEAQPYTQLIQPGNTESTIFDVGGGAHFFITDWISAVGDLRIEYALGDSFTVLKPTLGIAFHLGGQPPRDVDEDGISDVEDHCADTPYGATVDLRGCPSDTDGDLALNGLDECPGTPDGWPTDEVGCPTDVDGDGVPDGADQCADTLTGAVVDDVGCPIDSDGDEIFDGLDACEGTPTGAVVDETGCPIDSDNDEVWDGLDQCPDTPRLVVVDEVGCPVDSDDDGIFDGLDQCPGSAPGTNVDETGCPRIRPAVGEKLILEGVLFDSNSATLAEESYPILEEVLITMEYYGDWTYEIQGHTDNDGTLEINLALSELRAESVRQWFMERGIAEERLTSKGFGQSTPLTDNLTDIGKSRNRRVELLRIK
jgi:outer membrane protein OmpA-like peptidoglycan-associated protein